MIFLIILFLILIFKTPAPGQGDSCAYIVSNEQEIGLANEQARPGDVICLKEGEYSAGIAPRLSGEQNRMIIYRAFDESKRPTISRPVDLRNKSFITVSNVNIVATSEGKYYARLAGSDHVAIDNCRMTGNPPESPKHPPVDLTNATYAILRNNYVLGNNQDYNDLVQIAGNAHHNLLEGNTFEQGSHSSLLIEGPAHSNIVRGNEFTNDYHHCINPVFGTELNIIENNVFKRCGTGNSVGPGIDPAGSDGDVRIWSSENIYRFNILQKAGRNSPDLMPALNVFSVSVGDRLATVENNRIYNNIIYDNFGYGVRVGVGNNRLKGSCKENVFVNNILFNNGPSDLQLLYSHWGTPEPEIVTGEVWRNNLIGDTRKLSVGWDGSKFAISQVQSANPPISPGNVIFTNNIAGDPGFIDPDNNDFHIRSASNLIDAGDFLTKTTADGNGTVLKVEDARFFSDGLGIVQGDKIQVGEAGRQGDLYVTRADYSNNILDLNKSISWKNGDGVSFPYVGGMPDIGVYEYEAQQPSPFCYKTDAGVQLTCTSYTNINHLIAVVQEWGKSESFADYDESGRVEINDLITVVRNWQ